MFWVQQRINSKQGPGTVGHYLDLFHVTFGSCKLMKIGVDKLRLWDNHIFKQLFSNYTPTTASISFYVHLRVSLSKAVTPCLKSADSRRSSVKKTLRINPAPQVILVTAHLYNISFINPFTTAVTYIWSWCRSTGQTLKAIFGSQTRFDLKKKYCDFCVDHGNLTSGYVNDKGVRYGIA